MLSIRFLSVDDILAIHRRMVVEFGGDSGLRDRGLLESAIAMPRATFAGDFLHQSVPAMAAAYHYHLCSNHPFLDGNKRVAVASAEIFLLINGYELMASDDELIEITMSIAQSATSKETLTVFFEANVTLLL